VLFAAAGVFGAGFAGAAFPSAGSVMRGMPEHAAANVVQKTMEIGLMSNRMRHFLYPAPSGCEGPLSNAMSLEFRSNRNE
jgi:hypothetical protein